MIRTSSLASGDRDAPNSGEDGSGTPPRWTGFPVWPLVLVIYLALAVIAWWHVWSSGVSVTMAGGSADPAQEVWFLASALHAVERAGNPFLTRALFAPAGVNLLANTSILALGVLLSPVTAVFGPIVAFNVAVTIAPVASSLAAFFAIRRYAKWSPAAFAGGLCYGFGPFVGTDLRFGHLNLTFLFVPPLVLLALDELFVRKRRSAIRVGVALGLLVVLQFFISTELLALTVVISAVGVGVLALMYPKQAIGSARRAAPGLLAGFLVAAALLAYPIWFAIAGPRHLNGPVFSHLDNLTSTVTVLVLPHGERFGIAFISGGNGAYLGVPMLLLLIVAWWIYKRDPSLRFAVLMGGIAFLGSLGATLHLTAADTHVPLPEWLLQHLPLLDSIIASRFGAFVDLFAGMALAIVLDRIHAGDFGNFAVPGSRPAKLSWSRRHRPAVGAACALIVVVVLVPLLLLPPWPYPVRHVSEPPIFAERPLASLGQASIVLEYPPALVGDADPMLWQALGGMGYELSDGYALVPGAGGHATEEPPVTAVSIVFAAAVLGTLKVPVSASTDLAIRSALARDHIAAVVVTPGAKGSVVIAGVLTSALGRPTQRSAGSALWILHSARSVSRGAPPMGGR